MTVYNRVRNTGRKIDNRNYRTSSGPIWLYNVRCSGTETNIDECLHNGWGVHNCQHKDDVAVSCENGLYACKSVSFSKKNLRNGYMNVLIGLGLL